MLDIKMKVQGLDFNVKVCDVYGFVVNIGNVYEVFVIIMKWFCQLVIEFKYELYQKFEEFVVFFDVIEEVSENKEQIEIFKFYECLFNFVVIVFEEYINGEFYSCYNKKQEDDFQCCLCILIFLESRGQVCFFFCFLLFIWYLWLINCFDYVCILW